MALLAAATGKVRAEKDAGPVKQPPVASAAPPGVGVPDGYKQNMLIRTTLIALSQANQTGNYSVLRDLGTPQFQASNSAARLAEIFAALRARNLDMSPVVFFDPKLMREPGIESGGLLRLTGLIPTTPERILFDMGFERIGDQWRLSAIVIDVKAPTAEPAKPDAEPASDAASKAAPKDKGKPAKKSPVPATAP